MTSTVTAITKNRNKISSRSEGPQSGKEKVMSDSNLVLSEAQEQVDEVEQEQEGVYTGKVTRKVDSKFSGKKIVMTGNFSLPLANNIAEANDQQKGSQEDVVFWYNLGRKLTARQQVNQALSFEFGDKAIDDLDSAFNSAMDSFENMDKDFKERMKNFILNEPKFQPLKDAYAKREAEGAENVKSFDFSQIELKKPTGVKGRPPKEEKAEAAA